MFCCLGRNSYLILPRSQAGDLLRCCVKHAEFELGVEPPQTAAGHWEKEKKRS